MPLLRFTENVGTSGNNTFSGASLNGYFGLSGNDTFAAQSNAADPVLFMGGAGNDIFQTARGTTVVIGDASGTDRIIAHGLGFGYNTTFGLQIENRHLVAYDIASEEFFILLDWRDSSRRVESFELGDGTYSYDTIVANLFSDPNYGGNFTWEQFLTSPDFTNSRGFSGTDVREAIDFYYARDTALASGGGTTTPPPITDDYAAATSTTASVSAGSTANGNIETSGDVDWVRTSLTAGTAYTISVRGADSSGGTLADPFLVLRNSSGTYINQDYDSGAGSDAQLTYTPTTSGTYYIEARSLTSGATGTYTVGVSTSSGGGTTTPPTTTDDHTATTSTTATVTVGSTATGNLESSNDLDWIRVSLTAGTQYTINVRGSGSAGGTLSDPYLVLRNSTGGFVDQDDNTGTGSDAQITYTPSTSGNYYIEARSFGSPATGTYTVAVSSTTATPAPTADYAGSTSTTASLTVGGSLTSSISSASDSDWVRVSLTAGTPYTIAVKGAGSSSGTLVDPFLVLRNSSGTYVAQDDNTGAGLDAQLTFTPTTSGTYYVEARTYASGDAGTYTVSVSGAGSSSTAPQVDKATLLQMAVLSGVAYDYNETRQLGGATQSGTSLYAGFSQIATTIPNSNWVEVRSDRPGFLNNGFFENSISQGFVAYNQAQNALALVFTGSEDFLAIEDVVTAAFAMDNHYTRLDTLVEFAKEMASTLNVSTLYVTGHSLGGAMAHYFADSEADAFAASYRVQVVTFAAPERAPNSNLVSTTRIANTINVQNVDDSIPNGMENGVRLIFDNDEVAGGLTRHHAINTYIENARAVYESGYVFPTTLSSDINMDVSISSGEEMDTTNLTHADRELILGNRYGQTLEGNSRNNIMYGGGGADTLLGTTGNDTLYGGAGSDILNGGSGADIFAFSAISEAADTIQDYGSTDTIDLRPIFTTIGYSGNNPFTDGYLRLQSSGSNTLLQIDSNGNTGGSSFTTLATIQGVASSNISLASILWGGTLVTTDDYAASSSTTGQVTVGGSSVSGSIESGGDHDWYRVTLTAGVLYTFNALGSPTSNGTLSNPYLTLRNSSGTSINSDDNSGTGNNALLTYTPTSSGTYYIDASSSSSTATGTYAVSVTGASPLDDFAASTSTTATVIVSGNGSYANIESPGDHDWIRMTLTGGARYNFYVHAVSTTTPNFTISVRDSGGTSVANNGSVITYTAPTSGTYYLDASSTSTSGTGAYYVVVSLTSPQPAADDYSATTSTQGTVTAGSSLVSGNIESGADHDWYRVTLTAGVSYTINVLGSPTSNGTLSNPYLTLRNSSGTSINSDDNSGTGNNALLTYTPTSSGTYYIDASSSSSTATGTYAVSVTGTSVTDDYAANISTNGSITTPSTNVSVTGNLETIGDEDWFRITLNTGFTYRIDLEGSATGRGTLSDPELELRNSSGGYITGDDDSGDGFNSRITVTPTVFGSYYIVAREYGNNATGTYRVTVTRTGSSATAQSETPAPETDTSILALVAAPPTTSLDVDSLALAPAPTVFSEQSGSLTPTQISALTALPTTPLATAFVGDTSALSALAAAPVNDALFKKPDALQQNTIAGSLYLAA